MRSVDIILEKEKLDKKGIKIVLGDIYCNLNINYELFCNFLKSFEEYIEESKHSESLLKKCDYYFGYGASGEELCQYTKEKCPYILDGKKCGFEELKIKFKEYFSGNYNH